jgi:SDR family mycofactocin-dependent oxidoreductase
MSLSPPSRRAEDGEGGVAVVTGAGRGIGAAVARKLASLGWSLVLLDRCEDDPALAYPLASPADLDDVSTACLAAGARGVVSEQGDVGRQASLERAVRLAADRFGGLDAAIAVAGAIDGGPPAWEVSDRSFRAMLDVNLIGVWHLVRAAVPELLRRPRPRRGRVVAVSSAASLVGFPRLSAYTAAKHGVVGLVRSLAIELGPEEVTANVVAPGSTRTEMLRATGRLYGLDDAEELAEHHLQGRLLEPDEVAAAVSFLCGREASGITGAVMAVDSGLTAK